MKSGSKIVLLLLALLALHNPSPAQDRYGGYLLTIGYSDELLPGDFVSMLQQDLYALGYGSNIETDGGVTGLFGYGTYMAVLNFQKEHNLEANGVVSFETIRAMEQELFNTGGLLPVKVFADMPRLEYAGSFNAQISGADKSTFELETIRGDAYIIAVKGDVTAGVISPAGMEILTSQMSPLLANAVRDQIPLGYDQILYVDDVSASGTYTIEVEPRSEYLQSEVEILCFKVSF